MFCALREIVFMYARVTPYKMKPGSMAAGTKILNGLKDKVMALPGQQTFLNVMDDKTGKGYVISTTDIAEPTPETTEKIKGLWSAFSEYLEDQPSGETYTVVSHWKN